MRKRYFETRKEREEFINKIGEDRILDYGKTSDGYWVTYK